MQRPRLPMVAFFLSLPIALMSCGDHPAEPETNADGTQPARDASGHPVPEGIDTLWSSGSLIRLQVDTVDGVPGQSVLNAVKAAAQEWNEHVFDLPGHYNDLPHLVDDSVYTIDVSNPKIFIDYSDEGDDGWCGEATSGTNPPVDSTYTISIWRRDLADEDKCGGRLVDDLDGVISHEMSHAFDLFHVDTDETFWCAANVPLTGDLNQSPCSFEQQLIYRAYLLRNDWVRSTILLATRVKILTDVDTVVVNDTVTFTMAALSGPEPSDTGGTADTVTADVTWSSSNTAVLATDDQSGAVVDVIGMTAGTVDLIVTADPDTTTVWPWPADTVTVVVVRASGLDPCFDEENTSTSRYVDQFLEAEAICGTTGSGYQYRWQFEDGGTWTSYSTNPKYELSGHSSSGTDTVTLDVKKTATGDTALVSKEFSVGSTIISLTGPTYVTDKLLKTYTASQTGNWYERFNPDQYESWGYATSTNSSTYNRIWAAGEYDVALRNTKTVSGELRRRRLDVEVCYQCSPEEIIAGPGLGAILQDGTSGDDWGIFGAGPWIVGGTEEIPELARFYDLTGLHDEGTPFAEGSWLGGDGGVAEDSRGRWQVKWTKLRSTDPDVLGFEFTVTPRTGGDYEFGLAIDPDLGSPVDDESGYDPTRGMVYTLDRSMAVGLLLRGSGSDALSTVREYGARTLAPRAERDAWSATRDVGIHLATGPDDVQLILSADQVAGTTSWQLWIVRGSTVNEIETLADQVLARR